MIWEPIPSAPPYSSFCIPQHGQHLFLVEALRWLSLQTFRSFEVCTSNDGSPEARYAVIRELLDELGVPYRHGWSDMTLPYDPNVRTSFGHSRGRYCVLLENDDALAARHDIIEGAQGIATDRWDGSVMYQTYIGCRLLAPGLPLLKIDRFTVVKDLQIRC